MKSILGLSGSLRKASFNAGLLRAAAGLAPDDTRIEIGSIAEVPLYNGDVETAEGLPLSVQTLQAQLQAADGLLLVTPEYNNGIPGVFKNAIDWMSRQKPQPFKDKPVALMSATLGPVGGARHQYELRKVLGCLEALVMPRPEVFINLCQPKFDADVHLVDAAARKAVQDQMTAFGAWTARMLGR